MVVNDMQFNPNKNIRAQFECNNINLIPQSDINISSNPINFPLSLKKKSSIWSKENVVQLLIYSLATNLKQSGCKQVKDLFATFIQACM